ncbi:MAG: hypothetical protein GY869_22300, partial [Planctomycetes bacterium]|nr:hypothetical protein [Planctomycetota bacterium]
MGAEGEPKKRMWSPGQLLARELRTVGGRQETQLRNRVIALMVLLSLALVILLGVNLIYSFQWGRDFTIATAGDGSEYYTFGNTLKEVLAKCEPSIDVEVIKTNGSRENMDLVASGAVDLAIAQNDTPAEPDIRSLAVLFPEVLHLYVNK